MNSAAPKPRSYAQRLIDGEISRSGPSKSDSTVAFGVIEKLRPHFSALMGSAGFRALLSRALVLARADVAWLRDLQVKVDGAFEGLCEIEVQAHPQEIADGGMVLLDRLLGLLVNLIGEQLTLRLLSNVDDLELGAEK